MELRQLQYLTKLASIGSYRRAAQELGVSQPTLTRQIQDLERELGVTLIDRNRRPTQLTSAGELYLRTVERVFQELDVARAEVAAAAVTEAAPTLRLVVAPWGHVYVPRLISAFFREHGSVALDLRRYDDVGDLLNQVGSGDVDVAVGVIQAGSYDLLTDLSYQSMLVEKYGLVVSVHHPLARQSEVRIEDLAGERFILSSMYDFQRAALEEGMTRRGASPHVAIEARQELMMALVAENLGIGVTTPTVAASAAGKVAFLRVAGPFIACESVLIWSDRNRGSPVVDAFIRFAAANSALLSPVPAPA
jgi:LysR family transcriptional regulator, transcription activator of glutamate synthase operon